MKERLPALDWMRGIVMVLMAIDHASTSYNAGRLVTDSAWLYTPGMELPAGQFVTRWISHLCAPTFLFLAGTALALSVERRRQQGVASGSIDRDLLTRGLIILLLDPLYISFIWPLPAPITFVLQVLYAIGFSFLVMIALRRLGTRWLLALGVGLLVFHEALSGLVTAVGGSVAAWFGGLLVFGGQFGRLVVPYPVLPWLAMMLLGWVFGRYLRREDAAPVRLTAVTGAGALALFFVVRGLNGYGNFLLPREDFTWIQWLHCSKYPPSLSFTSLELGLMALMLAGLFGIQRIVGNRVNPHNPLLVFGQTALFFYLLHIPLLQFSAQLLGMAQQRGLGAAYLATLAVLVVLYPLCVWFRGYKAAHRDSWVRFI
jgi:uncharacterized membrane protein